MTSSPPPNAAVEPPAGWRAGCPRKPRDSRVGRLQRHVRRRLGTVSWLSLLVALCSLWGCATPAPGPLTSAEVCDILGIEVWRVPIPPGNVKQWTIGLEPYREPRVKPSIDEALPFRDRARISLRPVGQDSYEFTLAQNKGQSRGTLTIDVREAYHSPDNSYSISWHRSPLSTDDPRAFVIADIAHMLAADRRLQLVIRLEPVLEFPASSARPLKEH